MNVRPSEDIINNYDEIAELCRSTKEPVFITKDDDIDLVVTDINTYNERKMMHHINCELLAAEIDRLNGIEGCTVEELDAYLDDIIKNT
jgi:hypothetical protein